MKKKSNILTEYDFSGGLRGKYAKQFAGGTNIIVLDSDLAKIFPDSDAVNETLRVVAKIAMRSKKHIAA